MAWKFSDPPNLGVYALAEVLDRPASLRTVIHEVIGDWQFLDAEAVGEREAKVVSLKDVVDLDASITQLADLPLGWSATRNGNADAWERTPMVPLEWDDLVITATDYVQQCQDRLKSELKLDSWQGLELDHESGQFKWTANGALRIRGDMRIAGTLTRATDSWLWSWADDNVVETAQSDMEWLQAFGSENNLDRLSDAKWHARTPEAWRLASVACYLLQAEGLYVAPSEEGQTFVVLDNVRWVS